MSQQYARSGSARTPSRSSLYHRHRELTTVELVLPHPEEGEALAEVKKTNVVRLPIRMVNQADTKDKTHHDRLVELVQHMLSLYKRLVVARMPRDKTMLQQQIAATDRQIDTLVYELYGLTEEEIKIVEGKQQTTLPSVVSASASYNL